MKNILIDLNVHDEGELRTVINELIGTGLVELDTDYEPVRIINKKEDRITYVTCGKATEQDVIALEKLPYVYKIWNNSPIYPFCSCNNGKVGNLSKVAECIGAKAVWDKGHKGKGIVVGIVDGGIDKNIISEVINGSVPDWGTISDWNGHANMSATDALGVAPDIRLYDMRISDATIQPGATSNALQAYAWAITQFGIDGTPQILSNSWGIYQESKDPAYATDPNHPFTLKVLEVIDLGIKVLFSAGNCGETCPSSKCKNDIGGGRDIWGANGLKEVMTVGAVNLKNKRLQYSSQGPAALYDKKPDFCGYSQFEGYTLVDSGTSTACPVVAGCVALLLSYNPNLTQSQIQNLLQSTAKDNVGFNYDTGYGIVRVNNAYYELNPADKPTLRDRLCRYVYRTEKKCVQWKVTRTKECIETADQGYQECRERRDEGYKECNQWKEDKQKKCCSWIPCSWFCKAFIWVVSKICIGWRWVENIVCVSWTWVKKIVCVAWAWLVLRVCKLYLNIIKVVTFTNCKCH